MTTRIPRDLLEAITAIESDEKAEQAEVVRILLDKAVHEWKLAKALRMVSQGHWTVRRAARFAGLSYHQALGKMSEQGVDSGPALNELREAFDRS